MPLIAYRPDSQLEYDTVVLVGIKPSEPLDAMCGLPWTSTFTQIDKKIN